VSSYQRIQQLEEKLVRRQPVWAPNLLIFL